MNLASGKTILKVLDDKKRPLVLLRRYVSGKMLYILNRYVDMTENDKNIVRASYEIAFKLKPDEMDIQDLENFLSFSENKPCG
jgi:hypothetical protein